MGSKDRVPLPLKKLLQMDVKLTDRVCNTALKMCPGLNTTYRSHMKALEFSCHGIPWFALTLISIYLYRTESARELQVNLFFGLLYDIMIVAFTKSITRRHRPRKNKDDDMFFTFGPDKLSFPSGHATRAVSVALFFTNWAFPEMWFPFRLFLYIWALGVCISRVLMQRHHLLDVMAGIVIGFMEYFLIGILWIGPAASKWLGDVIASAEDEYN